MKKNNLSTAVHFAALLAVYVPHRFSSLPLQALQDTALSQLARMWQGLARDVEDDG